MGKELFDVEEESTGTKSLGGIILDSLEAGRVLVVDEFEKNLHPSITNYLISLFHNPLTNPKNAQLIFATHDITQLASGDSEGIRYGLPRRMNLGPQNCMPAPISKVCGLKIPWTNGTPRVNWVPPRSSTMWIF